MNGKRSEAKEKESRVKGNVRCYFLHDGLNPDPVFIAEIKYLPEVKNT